MRIKKAQFLIPLDALQGAVCLCHCISRYVQHISIWNDFSQDEMFARDVRFHSLKKLKSVPPSVARRAHLHLGQRSNINSNRKMLTKALFPVKRRLGKYSIKKVAGLRRVSRRMKLVCKFYGLFNKQILKEDKRPERKWT